MIHLLVDSLHTAYTNIHLWILYPAYTNIHLLVDSISSIYQYSFIIGFYIQYIPIFNNIHYSISSVMFIKYSVTSRFHAKLKMYLVGDYIHTTLRLYQ